MKEKGGKRTREEKRKKERSYGRGKIEDVGGRNEEREKGNKEGYG
jgi:hypothetical protein